MRSSNFSFSLSLMAFKSYLVLAISLFLVLQSLAESDGTVLFLDSGNRQFIRTRSADDVAQTSSLLTTEVGAVISVLLGLAPPSTLSAASSSMLNEVLMPNPFNRPRAVFMLEIKGAEDSQLSLDLDNYNFGSAFKSEIVTDSKKPIIHLPDGDKISMVYLDESLGYYSDGDCGDKDISEFASWLGGSYVTDATKPSTGQLSVPLENGIGLNFHLSKRADLQFVSGLVTLFQNLKRAIEVHRNLLDADRSPSELLGGWFDGIKVLQEQHGPEGATQQGTELLLATVSKLFESLLAAYNGEIVGVIVFNRTPYSGTKSMLNMKLTSQPSSRVLVESVDPLSSAASAIIRQILVRRVLAWTTGIILLISTILGVYFLMSMPLTRDTLLYSNVKLD